MKLATCLLSAGLLSTLLTSAQTNDARCKKIYNPFANSPFERKTTTPDDILQIWDGEIELEKRLIKNVHHNGADTLFVFTMSKSEVTFYKGSDNFFIRTATINDSRIRLFGGIKLGDSKGEVLRKMKINDRSNCDSIIITDDEDFAHHQLFFEFGKLSKVTLDFGMD